MSDVFAIFGTLLALGIAFPGMLTAWWLLFPKAVEGASSRVARNPWITLGLGLLVSGILTVPVFILFAISLPFTSFLGAVLLFGLLGFAGIGAAGITAHMAERLRSNSDEELSKAGAFVRAAVAFELAAAFPILGWFVVIPLSIIISMGAAVFGLLGSIPRPKAKSVDTTIVAPAKA
ncbi:MAG: hypothetical protein DWQ07_02500 [Chloroflexi bacterium]|nr:MAG: hypothetical protein DWQ07_02500 [Chloroflexota bacterium]MBL1193630.1 hypothetical protein [Chloroflexota bacterium]NOH10922.1 hypothetical protein [Chloroflexota bacterium]